MGAQRDGPRDQGAQQLPQRGHAGRDRRGHGGGHKAGLDLAQLLEVINTSSGVSFASLNRFPHIIRGDYLEGGLTGRLMAKDVRLYLALAGDLDVATLVGPGTLTAFQVSNALGYGDMISNRVVDAFGDLAGGIRVAEQED